MALVVPPEPRPPEPVPLAGVLSSVLHESIKPAARAAPRNRTCIVKF